MTVDLMAKLRSRKQTAQNEGYSFLIVGPYGVGKTSTLDDPELKILYLDIEKGGAVLPDRDNILVPDTGIESWEDIMMWLEWLEDSPDNRANFDVVALDGMSRAFELAIKYALEKTPQVKRMADGVPAQADWNHFPRLFKEMVKRFHELTKHPSNKKPIHVVFIGHTHEVKDEITGIVEFKINLQGKDTADVFGSVVDLVGFQNILFRKPKDAPEDAEPEKQYVLFLRPSQYNGKQFNAKIRVYKEVSNKVPPAMKDPTIRRLINMMYYLKQEYQKLKSQPQEQESGASE